MTTSKDILKSLRSKYINTAKYSLCNRFIFNWESDYFCIKDNGYSYEIEVKISRSDFLADFKKLEKHKRLSDLSFKPDWVPKNCFDGIPNKFFYCVPKDLIKVDEVPKYAGLMYFDENKTFRKLETVKEAPLLHKIKLDYSKRLLDIYYYAYLDECNKNLQMIRRLTQLTSNNYEKITL